MPQLVTQRLHGLSLADIVTNTHDPHERVCLTAGAATVPAFDLLALGHPKTAQSGPQAVRRLAIQ